MASRCTSPIPVERVTADGVRIDAYSSITRAEATYNIISKKLVTLMPSAAVVQIMEIQNREKEACYFRKMQSKHLIWF